MAWHRWWKDLDAVLLSHCNYFTNAFCLIALDIAMKAQTHCGLKIIHFQHGEKKVFASLFDCGFFVVRMHTPTNSHVHNANTRHEKPQLCTQSILEHN